MDSISAPEQIAVLQQQNNLLRGLLAALATASAERDLERAVGLAVEAACQVLAADRWLVLLAWPRTNFRTIPAARGFSEAYLQHVATGHLPLQRAIELNGRFSVADVLDEASGAVNSVARQVVEAEGFHGVSGVALRQDGEPFGALLVYFDQPRQLNEDQLELLQMVADHVAARLSVARDFELVEQVRLAREKSEERLQSILDRINDLVIVWSPEMEVLVANARARRFMAELGADSAAKLVELLPRPDNCPVHEVFRSGQPVVGCELRMGESIYAVDAHPLTDSETGEILAAVSHARDVTLSHQLQRELAANEERVRVAMEMAPVGIAVLDAPGMLIEQTNRLVGHWAGKNTSDLCGQQFVTLFAAEDQATVANAWDEVLSLGEAMVDHCHMQQLDGTLLPVSLTLGLIEYGRGQRTVQVIVKDIKRRLKLQAQLTEQEKLAAIGQLASGVAHELRNPMGIIASALFDLEEILETQDDEVREDLRIAREEILRAQEIINNVLDFARVGTAEREFVDLAAVFQQAVSLLGKSMATRDISVELSADELPEIWANRGGMRQVALNLLTNSYQATPDGGTVSVRLWCPDADHVAVSVSDTGAGIPKDALPRIFNPFFTTKAPGQGTGLGLSIVYAAVHEHGGEIEVDSELGRGTTFRMLLPRRTEATPRLEQLQPLVQAADELL
ncbi:MAG: PAS domain S-box protein [Armatimonadetes bacterium]|nr:PAS domain S-box protein [Armatimonadota bacterium]